MTSWCLREYSSPVPGNLIRLSMCTQVLFAYRQILHWPDFDRQYGKYRANLNGYRVSHCNLIIHTVYVLCCFCGVSSVYLLPYYPPDTGLTLWLCQSWSNPPPPPPHTHTHTKKKKKQNSLDPIKLYWKWLEMHTNKVTKQDTLTFSSPIALESV